MPTQTVIALLQFCSTHWNLQQTLGEERKNYSVCYSPGWNGSAEAVPSTHSFWSVCFLPVHITMMSDQEQFNIPIFLNNELYRYSLPLREVFALKLVAQLETMLSPEPSVLLLKHLSVLVSTCSLPPGAPQTVRPRLSVVWETCLTRARRHCRESEDIVKRHDGTTESMEG